MTPIALPGEAYATAITEVARVAQDAFEKSPEEFYDEQLRQASGRVAAFARVVLAGDVPGINRHLGGLRDGIAPELSERDHQALGEIDVTLSGESLVGLFARAAASDLWAAVRERRAASA